MDFPPPQLQPRRERTSPRAVARPTCALAALLLAAGTLAGPAQAGRAAPSHLRLPMQADFDRCALAASEYGQENLQGRLRLELLIRQSGNVFAAFVHSEAGIEDRRFERCITSATQLWVLSPVAIDYRRSYEITVVPGGIESDPTSNAIWDGRHFAGQGRASVFMPSIDDPPKPGVVNAKAARETLEIADWATLPERGIAELAAGRYPEAIAALRLALQDDPNDLVALRGLSQALAESRGDLAEARAKANLAVSLAPFSVGSHEALLRVCLASGDDECAFRTFQAASKAADLGPRSRLLADLQPQAEQAAARLRASALAARRLDPCGNSTDDRALSLCLLRRCLEDGAAARVAELGGKGGAWALQPGGEGKFIATRPLGAHDTEDPRWLVQLLPRAVRMTPVNASARALSEKGSRCAVVARGAGEVPASLSIEQPVVRAGPVGTSSAQ